MKYSKVYIDKEEKHFGFRYNYQDGVLERISRLHIDFDEYGNLVDIIKPDWEVIDSMGLCVEEWKENPIYWIEQYEDFIEQECQHILKYEFI